MQLLQETAARRGQDWSLELGLVTGWMLSIQYLTLTVSEEKNTRQLCSGSARVKVRDNEH